MEDTAVHYVSVSIGFRHRFGISVAMRKDTLDAAQNDAEQLVIDRLRRLVQTLLQLLQFVEGVKRKQTAEAV